MAQYLEAELGTSFAIVAGEVQGWSIAMLASARLGHSEALTGLDRIVSATVSLLVVLEQLLPVNGRGLLAFHRPAWYYFLFSFAHRRLFLATPKKELDTLATGSFFKCKNKRCMVLIPGIDLKRNNGKCPICNTPLAKPK